MLFEKNESLFCSFAHKKRVIRSRNRRANFQPCCTVNKRPSSLLTVQCTVEPFAAFFALSALYLPPPDPARRPGIAQPQYRHHVLIWSCCPYRGGGRVQLSNKAHYFAHLALINLWCTMYSKGLEHHNICKFTVQKVIKISEI